MNAARARMSHEHSIESSSKRLASLALLVLLVPAPLMAQQARIPRPGAASGPTKILVSIVVVDVFAINDVDETFSGDFAVALSWKDERLALEDATEAPTTTYRLEDVWNPGMIVVNTRGLTAEFPELVEVEPDGTVNYLQRFYGTLSAAFDLHDFPGDLQRLPIRLAFVGYTPEEVSPEPDPVGSVLLENAAVSGWALRVAASGEAPVVVDENEALAGFSFQIEARREAGYFIWTMMVPLTLIVLMAWMVFWIDPSYLPSQVGLSTAAVFSLVAYRTSLRLALPMVSYMTRADVFILGATLLVFGALVHAVGTGRLAKTGREELARTLDRRMRWLYLLLFAATVAVAAVW